MAMVASLEHVLHLFNSAWFQHQILTKESPHHTTQQHFINKEEEPEEFVEVEGTRTLKFRSHSDHDLLVSFGTNLLSDSESPTSVLPTPKLLQTIFSGKQVCRFDKPATPKDAAPTKPTKRNVVNKQRRSQGAGSSKSLTDLEFKEIKGFKDLGFVFSEEDHKDADLISIVPGLQRIAYSISKEAENIHVQRPYLSEAWGVMEKKKKKEEAFLKPNALIINHKIRQVGMENEIMMKEQIKDWAHSVASAIR